MAIALFHAAGELRRIVRDLDNTFDALIEIHKPLPDEAVIEMPGNELPSLSAARAFVAENMQ